MSDNGGGGECDERGPMKGRRAKEKRAEWSTFRVLPPSSRPPPP